MSRMFLNLFNEESTESRMLNLVAIHCPRLMREGGGGLTQEISSRAQRRRPWVTDEQRQQIAAMAREGKNGTEIARVMGISQSSACRALERVGVKARDGRKANA